MCAVPQFQSSVPNRSATGPSTDAYSSRLTGGVRSYRLYRKMDEPGYFTMIDSFDIRFCPVRIDIQKAMFFKDNKLYKWV